VGIKGEFMDQFLKAVPPYIFAGICVWIYLNALGEIETRCLEQKIEPAICKKIVWE